MKDRDEGDAIRAGLERAQIERLDALDGDVHGSVHELEGGAHERFHDLDGNVHERFRALDGDVHERFRALDGDVHERFRALVDAALDDRRDPLADPEVQRLVAEDPRRFEELARLQRGLAAVRELSVAGANRRPGLARFGAAGAAVLLLAAAGTWLAATQRMSTDGPGGELARADFAVNTGPSRVLSFEARLVHATPLERVTIVRDGARETVRREHLQDPACTPRDAALGIAHGTRDQDRAASTADTPRLAVQEFVAVVSTGAVTR